MAKGWHKNGACGHVKRRKKNMQFANYHVGKKYGVYGTLFEFEKYVHCAICECVGCKGRCKFVNRKKTECGYSIENELFFDRAK
jgi:hypothetical protein